MKDNNNLRMTLKAALDNLWSRISGIFGTVNGRIDGAEAHIDDVESELTTTKGRVTSVENRMTTAEGQINGLHTRVGDLEDAVDDLDGAMIKTISLNGVNVPKDAQGNVALQETDPTVPAWAKQAKAKTSDFTNDGDGTDNNSPFATQEYVRQNGGKIDEIRVNNVTQAIVNKMVNIRVPTSLDDLDDALYVEINGTATNIHDQLSGLGNGGFTFFKAEHPEMDMLLGKAMPSKYVYGTLVGTIVNCPLPDGTDQYYLNGYYNYYDGQGTEEETGVAVSHFDFTDEPQGGYSLYVYDSAIISNGGSGGSGVSGSFMTADGKTVTVANGLIASITI